MAVEKYDIVMNLNKAHYKLVWQEHSAHGGGLRVGSLCEKRSEASASPPLKKGKMDFTEQAPERFVSGRSGLAWGTFWGCFGFCFIPLRKNWVLGHVFLLFRFFPF